MMASSMGRALRAAMILLAALGALACAPRGGGATRLGEPPAAAVDDVVSLNGPWRFRYYSPEEAPVAVGQEGREVDDSGWATIDVPSNWEMQGFGKPSWEAPDGSTGWYRRVVSVPAGWEGRRVFLRFEGVAFAFDAWVDGKPAGGGSSAFTRTELDITPLVVPGGEHLLALRVHSTNRDMLFDTGDSWALSGIFRDVELIARPAERVLETRLVARVDAAAGHAFVDGHAVASTAPGDPDPGLEARFFLLEPDGAVASQSSAPVRLAATEEGTQWRAEWTAAVPGARLWTAETPELYGWRVELRRGRDVVHVQEGRTGLREVVIRDRILLLNGSPVKLRGINRLELDPDAGRALREEHWRRDIELMKAAHINFVRTAHHPPHPRFIELCDELGLYVMLEVPFSKGDSRLSDSSFLSELYKRADATVRRDWNQPSVIIHSIGDESDFLDVVDRTARYTRSLDPTRPVCVPMSPDQFARHGHDLPPHIDMLAPHYPSPRQLLEMVATADRPIIVTAYAHSLGLAFEDQGALWRIMESIPLIAGGAVWQLRDQGIRRESASGPAPMGERHAWPTATTFLDTSGADGADGILFADGQPQPDYHQLARNHATAVVEERTIVASPGDGDLVLTIGNRLDFAALPPEPMAWSLWRHGVKVDEGVVDLPAVPARGTAQARVELAEPLQPAPGGQALRVEARWQAGAARVALSRALRVAPPGGEALGLGLGSTLEARAPERRHISEGGERAIVAGPWQLGAPSGPVRLVDTRDDRVLVSQAFLPRVGRTPTMAETRAATRHHNDPNAFWSPPVLRDVMNPYRVAVAGIVAPRIDDAGVYPRPDVRGPSIRQEWSAFALPTGAFRVRYTSRPERAEGFLLEAGVAMALPAEFTHARWIGLGPWPSYPGQSEHNDFGHHHITTADMFFDGARAGVELALFTNDAGDGVVILADNATLHWERRDGELWVSHCALIAGRGTGARATEYPVRADSVTEFTGEFLLVPLRAGEWPGALRDAFDPAIPPADKPSPYVAWHDRD